MLMNIQVLLKIKEYIDKYDYLFDAIMVRSELDGESIEDMISKDDKDIFDLLNMNFEIDKLLLSLTEDVRDAMYNAGVICNDYTVWSNQLKYNPMLFTELYEVINDVHGEMEEYLYEEFKGYKILTQPAYNQEIFNELSPKNAIEKGTE